MKPTKNLLSTFRKKEINILTKSRSIFWGPCDLFALAASHECFHVHQCGTHKTTWGVMALQVYNGYTCVTGGFQNIP